MMMLFVAIAAAGILLFALIGLVSKSTPELDKAQFRSAWKLVLDKAATEAGWEISIINADKLLDAALKRRKFKGETMGERLVSAKNVLSKRQAVWDAHKLRNRLVHEENVRLSHEKVLTALKGFESALKDVGAL